MNCKNHHIQETNDIRLAEYLNRIVAICLIERPDVAWLMASTCSDNWLKIHRLLLLIHEEADADKESPNSDQLIQELGLEIVILEALIESLSVNDISKTIH